MAITITTVFAGTDTFIADIEATADADVSAVIPHLLGATPAEYTITNLLQASAGLSLWAITGVDATNVTCTASAAVGSGAAGAQIRVIIKRPHSLGR